MAPLTIPLGLLAGLRAFIGTSSFLLPNLTTQALFYPVPAGSLLAVRLFGARDAVLASLLWTAKTPEARRRAVLAGVAADTLDVVAVGWGILNGDVDPLAAGAFGGGAVSFLILTAFAWKGAGLGKVVAKAS
jgi:hypothetical protein